MSSQNKSKTGRTPATAFKPGQSGNPGGRPKVNPDVKRVLAADTLKTYNEAWKLYRRALRAKNLRVAKDVLLGLLKKMIPDTNELLIAAPLGGPVEVSVTHVEPAKPNAEKLRRIAAVLKKAGVLDAIEGEATGESGT